MTLQIMSSFSLLLYFLHHHICILLFIGSSRSIMHNKMIFLLRSQVVPSPSNSSFSWQCITINYTASTEEISPCTDMKRLHSLQLLQSSVSSFIQATISYSLSENMLRSAASSHTAYNMKTLTASLHECNF